MEEADGFAQTGSMQKRVCRDITSRTAARHHVLTGGHYLLLTDSGAVYLVPQEAGWWHWSREIMFTWQTPEKPAASLQYFSSQMQLQASLTIRPATGATPELKTLSIRLELATTSGHSRLRVGSSVHQVSSRSTSQSLNQTDFKVPEGLPGPQCRYKLPRF